MLVIVQFSGMHMINLGRHLSRLRAGHVKGKDQCGQVRAALVIGQ